MLNRTRFYNKAQRPAAHAGFVKSQGLYTNGVPQNPLSHSSPSDGFGQASFPSDPSFSIARFICTAFLLSFLNLTVYPDMSQPRILYCHCTYAKVVPEETKEQVLEQLSDSGVAFEAVADLCEMSARKDPALQRLAQGGTIKVAACYPRAVKWLFQSAGAPLDDGAEVLNMREQNAGEICRACLDGMDGVGGETTNGNEET